MDQRGQQNAEEQKFSCAKALRGSGDHAVLVQILFQRSRITGDKPLAVESAHHDRKGTVTGYSGDHTRQAGNQSAGKYIHHVFRRGKSKRNEGRVNNAVKQTVEVLALPGQQEHKEPLEALFHQRDAEKVMNKFIEIHFAVDKRIFILSDILTEKQSVVHNRQQQLHDHRRDRSAYAEEEQSDQQTLRLLFDTIHLVDVKEQQYRRQQTERHIDFTRRKHVLSPHSELEKVAAGADSQVASRPTVYTHIILSANKSTDQFFQLLDNGGSVGTAAALLHDIAQHRHQRLFLAVLIILDRVLHRVDRVVAVFG